MDDNEVCCTIADLEAITDLINSNEELFSGLVKQRDEAIRKLKSLKVPDKKICLITGLTRQRIQQLNRK